MQFQIEAAAAALQNSGQAEYQARTIDRKVMKRSRMGATEARPGYTLETAATTAGSGLATTAPPTGTCKHRRQNTQT
jgi:hypothetical protein